VTTAYDPLHNPGSDRTPDVPTVDLALHQARTALDHCATANIHSHGEMMTAATELDFVLRQLVAALDAERGERR
jgi:hypothetical protein